MPDPFGLKDNTFIASGIANFSDKSWLARLDYQVTVLSFLAVSVFGSVHAGQIGEFHLSFNIPALPVPGLEMGAFAPKPVVDFGAGVSIRF